MNHETRVVAHGGQDTTVALGANVARVSGTGGEVKKTFKKK